MEYTGVKPVIIAVAVAAGWVVCPTVIAKLPIVKLVAFTTSNDRAVILPAVKPAAANSELVKIY